MDWYDSKVKYFILNQLDCIYKFMFPRDGPKYLFLILEMFVLCLNWQDLGSKFPRYGWVRVSCLASAIFPFLFCWCCSDSKLGTALLINVTKELSFTSCVPPASKSHWDEGVETVLHTQSCLCLLFLPHRGSPQMFILPWFHLNTIFRGHRLYMVCLLNFT